MSCWTCDCGYRNCDTDECFNPKCPTHTALTFSGMVNRLHQAGAVHFTDHLKDIRRYNNCWYSLEDVNKVVKQLESKI